MPKPPLPPDLVAFLAEPNPSVIATMRSDGSPHTAATWYLWVDGRVIVNMDEGRRRLEHLRQEPRVSITVLGRDDVLACLGGDRALDGRALIGAR